MYTMIDDNVTLDGLLKSYQAKRKTEPGAGDTAILTAVQPLLPRLLALGYRLVIDDYAYGGLWLESKAANGNDLPFINLSTVSTGWEQRQAGNYIARVTWSAEANSTTGVYVSDDDVPAPKAVRGRKLEIDGIEAFVKEVKLYMAAKVAFKTTRDAEQAERDRVRKAEADAAAKAMKEAEAKTRRDGSDMAVRTCTGLVSSDRSGFKLEVAFGLYVEVDADGQFRRVVTVNEKSVIEESPLTAAEVVRALKAALAAKGGQ